MSSYEFAFTYLDKNCQDDGFMKSESFLFGLRPMVPVSSAFAAGVRAIFESPIEYAKVMGQTRQQWHMKDAYRGVGFQVTRTTALLLPIFSTIDICRRKTDLLSTLLGNFMVTAGASGAAYLICWPLETLKNLAQSGTPRVGATLKQRLDYLGGPIGLYRGVWVGTVCGAFRNGCGMIAMVYAQKYATKFGLRD